MKLASFFGAFAFPVITPHLGSFWATLSVSSLSLIGFLSAKFILPELSNFVDPENAEVSAAGIVPLAE